MYTQTCPICQVAFRPDTEEEVEPGPCPVCLRHVRAPHRVLGIVMWFQARRGFGFIRTATGERVFCHVSHLRRGQRLQAGDLVELQCVQGRRNREARDVRRLASHRDLQALEAQLPSEA